MASGIPKGVAGVPHKQLSDCRTSKRIRLKKQPNQQTGAGERLRPSLFFCGSALEGGSGVGHAGPEEPRLFLLHLLASRFRSGVARGISGQGLGRAAGLRLLVQIFFKEINFLYG